VHNNADSSLSPEVSSGDQLVQQLLRKATFLSDYDELCGRLLHKFSSQSQLQDALSMFQCAHIDVPLLAIQPEDDPLHAVCSIHSTPISPSILTILMIFTLSLFIIKS